MLKLKDFLQNIALGELQGSPVVEIGSWEINPDRVPQVIQALNQGLEYFYSNFPLRTNEVILKVTNGITRYYLDSDYAISSDNANGFVKYIMDTPDRPFQDDVLHITSVESTSGLHFTLNDANSYININVPEYNCVQVENSHGSEYLLVKYMARHPKISLTEPRDSNVRIYIPSSYETALQTYVACLVYQNMGGNHLQESNALYAKFKSITEELKLSGIGVLTQTGYNIKPHLRGWV